MSKYANIARTILRSRGRRSLSGLWHLRSRNSNPCGLRKRFTAASLVIAVLVSMAPTTPALAASDGRGMSFLLPTTGTNATTFSSLSYREHDGTPITNATRWLPTTYSDTAVTGQRKFTIDGSMLRDDTTYDFVLTYRTGSAFTFPYYVYKIAGTFERTSANTWISSVAESSTVAATVLPTDPASGYQLNWAAHPTQLRYQASILPYLSTNPAGKHGSIDFFDALDGTECLYNYTAAALAYYTYYYGGPASPLAGYPQYTPITAANKDDLAFPYHLATTGYHTATGAYYPWVGETWATSATRKTTGGVVTPADTHHTVDNNSTSGTLWAFKFNLQQSALEFVIPLMPRGRAATGIIDGTQLIADPNNATVCPITMPTGKNAFFINFDAVTGIETLKFTLAYDGLAPIPLEFSVNGTAKTITLKNLAQISDVTNEVSYNAQANLFEKIRQIPQLEVTQTAQGLQALSPGLAELLLKIGSYVPGVAAHTKFSVVGDATKSYKVTGYSVERGKLPDAQVLRPDSPAIKRFFATYDYTARLAGTPTAEGVYNFEGITGMSLYDGLLKLYREHGYPQITTLEELPAAVLAAEVLGGHDVYFPSNAVDNGGSYSGVDLFLHSSNEFGFIEKDAKMIELANYHLYHNSLIMTFDKMRYPFASLASPGIAGAGSEKFLYESYCARTSDNRAMMDALLAQMPVLRAGSQLFFNDFSYGVYGDYIWNMYRPSDYGLTFNFNLLMSVVGIEGIAFNDANKNGNFDSGEAIFAGRPVELWKDGGSMLIATTTTDRYGRYEFPNVPADSGYYLKVGVPAGYSVTPVTGTLDTSNKFTADACTDKFVVVLDQSYHFNIGFVATSASPDVVDPPVDPPKKPQPPLPPKRPQTPPKPPITPKPPHTGDYTALVVLVAAVLLAAGITLYTLRRKQVQR